MVYIKLRQFAFSTLILAVTAVGAREDTRHDVKCGLTQPIATLYAFVLDGLPAMAGAATNCPGWVNLWCGYGDQRSNEINHAEEWRSTLNGAPNWIRSRCSNPGTKTTIGVKDNREFETYLLTVCPRSSEGYPLLDVELGCSPPGAGVTSSPSLSSIDMDLRVDDTLGFGANDTRVVRRRRRTDWVDDLIEERGRPHYVTRHHPLPTDAVITCAYLKVHTDHGITGWQTLIRGSQLTQAITLRCETGLGMHSFSATGNPVTGQMLDQACGLPKLGTYLHTVLVACPATRAGEVRRQVAVTYCDKDNTAECPVQRRD